MGSFGPVIDFPIVPVAVALVGANYDQVLAWSAYQANSFDATANVGQTYTALLDLPSMKVSEVVVSTRIPDALPVLRGQLSPSPPPLATAASLAVVVVPWLQLACC